MTRDDGRQAVSDGYSAIQRAITYPGHMWKCPDPNCPPTEFPPEKAEVMNEPVSISLCGKCGKEFPTKAIKRVR